MTQEKLKGFVREETLRDVLSRSAQEVGYDRKTKEIKYWTGAKMFIARRVSVRYHAIYHVKGV
jgi:hypothetical protein